MDDQAFMNLALEQAKLSAMQDEVPIGAVIVKDNEVIAFAHNERETLNVSTAHAEILVIEKACKLLKTWRLTGCTIYVTLQPCLMCSGAIVLSRFDRVVFGAYDQKINSIDYFKIDKLNHYPEVVGGVLEKQCSSIIKAYFKNKRKGGTI